MTSRKDKPYLLDVGGVRLDLASHTVTRDDEPLELTRTERLLLELFLRNPEGHGTADRRRVLDTLRTLNEAQLADVGDPEIATRISQYELAFRMQESVPELMDISREPAPVLEAYGATPGDSSFANNCLLARRLLEKGVRFVQLFDWGWDFHGTRAAEDIRGGLTRKMAQTDKPVAALIRDNKTCRSPSDQQTGAKYGMKTLDQGLVDWYIKGRISRDTVINRCIDSQAILGKLQEADAAKESAEEK